LSKVGEAWEKGLDWQQALLIHASIGEALLEAGDNALQSLTAKLIETDYHLFLVTAYPSVSPVLKGRARGGGGSSEIDRSCRSCLWILRAVSSSALS
jgi:hypothetical protein